MTFQTFAKAVHVRYAAMAKNELFVVDTEDLHTSYLLAFPEGTNPMFRKQTEHDCSTCKNFIRNLGGVVALDPATGAVTTVWSGHSGLPEPYATVAARMDALVAQARIKGVYRTKERQYGAEHNHDSETSQRWHHFYGRVGAPHYSLTPDADRGKAEEDLPVLRRGLTELTTEALSTIVELVEAKALYRGEEHLRAVREFSKLHAEYQVTPDRESFVWRNMRHKAAGFRNTAIGTLAQDLSAGVEVEQAVRKFESKVAPTSYKRSTAVITPKMVEQAVEKLRGLGLEDAVQRRHARAEDLSVNDVKFVDNAVRGRMKDGLTDMLMAAAKPRQVDLRHATDISVEDFLALKPTTVDVVVRNAQLGNFVSLTAPQHAGSGKLFKWANDFAWSYDGEVADSMRQRVAAAGGRVDGVLRFTHQWNHTGRNASLMDLHVFMPGSSAHQDGHHDRYPTGPRVGWNRRTDAASAGVQDVDYTNPAPAGYVPVENITFPTLGKLRPGVYTFKVHNWNLRQPTTSGFSAEIEVAGQLHAYDYPKAMGHKEWITVAKATLKDGVFTMEHCLPASTVSRQKWGVPTEVLVPVDTILLSPNHWEGAGEVGNKHWIFALRDCKNPDPVRGIYNEFLRSELDPHRKVFEVLGAKTKCPPAEEQLSGVGFSSTRKDVVTAVVDGRRAYNIKF